MPTQPSAFERRDWAAVAVLLRATAALRLLSLRDRGETLLRVREAKLGRASLTA